MVGLQVQRGRQGSDQLRYHEVVVREFARDWPALNFDDYLSATTPGYHIAIATGAKVMGDQRWKLQALGSLFTIAFVGLFAWTLSTRAPPGVALALALPMATSLYVWPTAVWLLPDGAGWLGVLVILLLALDAKPRTRTQILAGLALLALVFVRQSHLWAAAVLWTAAWLPASLEAAPDQNTRVSLFSEFRSLLKDPKTRARAAIWAVLATLPAFLLVAWFASIWGGLTPPSFAAADSDQPLHTAVNPATPAYVLAVFGALSPFYVAFFWASLRTLARKRPYILAGAGLIALVIAVVPATSYDMDAGRWTGIVWSLAQRAPVIADHTSSAIALLAIIGAIVILALLCAIPARTRWILLAALAAFTAAQTANFQAWQRYVEPFALMWLALACVRIPTPEQRGLAYLRWVLPAILGVGFAVLTALSLWQSKPFPTDEYDRTVLPAIEASDDQRLTESLDRIGVLFRDQAAP